MRAYIKESFGKDPDRERNVRRELYPYLTASALYVGWRWDAQQGLSRDKGRHHSTRYKASGITIPSI
jgi:hypothetical protein